jgi:hypothetical protein
MIRPVLLTLYRGLKDFYCNFDYAVPSAQEPMSYASTAQPGLIFKSDDEVIKMKTGVSPNSMVTVPLGPASGRIQSLSKVPELVTFAPSYLKDIQTDNWDLVTETKIADAIRNKLTKTARWILATKAIIGVAQNLRPIDSLWTFDHGMLHEVSDQHLV